MNYVLIIHEVEDYQLWKIAFDNAADIRKEAGEMSFQLLKYETEQKMIVHLSKWTSLEAAKHFFESAEVARISEEAGVKMQQFIYLNELEKGIL